MLSAVMVDIYFNLLIDLPHPMAVELTRIELIANSRG